MASLTQTLPSRSITTQPAANVTNTATFSSSNNQGFQLGHLVGDITGPVYFNAPAERAREQNTTTEARGPIALKSHEDAELLWDRYSNLPPDGPSDFVQRHELRDELKRQLHDALPAPQRRSRIVAVQGPAGAGKTDLVLHYAQEFSRDYKGVFWINAGHRLSIERDIAVIFRFLFPSSTWDDPHSPWFEEMLRLVKEWVSASSQKWLWVFDGADNLENSQDPDYVNLAALIPSSSAVHAIVTTRSPNAWRMTQLQPIEVGPMDRQQSLDLFWAKCGKADAAASPPNCDTAAEIVEELGYLALAITLAGSHIFKSPLLASNLSQYLSDYRRARRRLRDLKPRPLIARYGENVLTVWEMAFKSIKNQSSLATNLICFVSLLDPEDLYLDLFTVAMTEQVVVDLDDTADEMANWQQALFPDGRLDFYTIEAAFQILESYSFMHFRKSKFSYSMHKLVQEWGYARCDGKTQLKFRRAATDFLTSVVAQCTLPNNRSRIAKHIMALFGILSDAANAELDKVWMSDYDYLYNFGKFVHDLELWTEAGLIFNYQYQRLSDIHGTDHTDTIDALNNLAVTLNRQGRLDEATSMQRDVLQRRIRTVGEEHLDTVRAKSNLASLLSAQGHSDNASSIQREVVNGFRRLFGDDHVETRKAIEILENTEAQSPYSTNLTCTPTPPASWIEDLNT